MIAFFVHGVPVPQGSKRLVDGRMIESNAAKLRDWRQQVSSECSARANGDRYHGPVSVHLTFFFARPKTHFGTGRNSQRLKESLPLAPSVRPDLDKLVRAALDALTGVAFDDDAQVARLSATKAWADEKPPGVNVMVWTID